MVQAFQIEELGVMSMTMVELLSIDGGDTVNTSYHGGQSQLSFEYLHTIADFFSGFADGITGR